MYPDTPPAFRRLGSVTARCALLLLSCLLAAPQVHAEIDAVQVVINAGDQALDTQMTQNIRANLSLARLQPGSPVPSVNRIRYLLQKAEQEVYAGLYPLGYFNSRVETQLEQTEQGWRATYTIDPGPRATIAGSELSIDGEGASDPQLNGWQQNPALQPGAALDQAAYDSIKADLLERAVGLGYYAAQFREAQISVERMQNSASIKLSFDTGPHYRLRQIQFSEAPVNDELLQRYRTLQPGEPVQTDQLLQMQRGLVDSGYFSGVEVQPQWDQVDSAQQIPVDVFLTANQRTAYRFGAGYGTDTGVRTSASQKRRWVNTRGHRMDSVLRLSEVTNTLLFNYEIPGKDPVNDTYVGRGAYEQEQSESTDSETWSVALQEQRARGNRNWSWGLGIEQETYRFGDVEESTLLMVPEGSWTQVSADNRLNPRQGYRISVDLSAASESVLSDTSFVQGELNAKAVYSLSDNLRLLPRLDLGATAVTDFNRMPASRRFFTGGDTSVRGYAYKELGPTDSEGEVRGGRYLLAGSIEVDYRVAEDWRAALFWDTGNAFDSLDTPLKSSVGIGGRWQSPVGPVRVDLAKPIDDTGFRIHFTLGPDL